jgi:hypothetical protein
MGEQEQTTATNGPARPVTHDVQEVQDAQDAVELEVSPARPVRWIPVAAIALLLAGGLLWWALGWTSPQPETTALPLAEPNTLPTVRPSAEAVRAQEAIGITPSPVESTSAESLIVTPTVALPTVTPTTAVAQVATRTVTIGGQATLRLELEGATFESSGRPIDLPLEPRTYTVGAETSTIIDRWCVQVGVTSLIFDLTMALNSATEAVKTTGNLHLHDGFCDAPGGLLVSSPVDLEIPADASAEVPLSLQTRTHLLGVTDLLDTNTGVFVGLVISNTRPR